MQIIRSIFLFFISQYSIAQMSFTKTQLIGSWELEYSSAKGCVGGFIKPVLTYGQSFITFNDSITYTRFMWGNQSNGYYTIDETQNTILFDPIFDQGSLSPRPYLVKIAMVEDDQLTFLIEDTCGIYERVYNSVNLKKLK